MDKADYYLLNGDQEQGPWTLSQVQNFLQTGAVTLETLYAQPGMSEWKPLSAILGAASPTAAEPSVAETTVKQLGLQVGFDNIIQSAIQTTANLISKGAFDGISDDDKKTMGWEWYALHDGHHICDKCEFYDGQRWTKDYKPFGDGPEFPGKPPLCAGCQCALIPVDLGGAAPAKTGLDDSFRSQSDDVLNVSFGKANVEAFKSGRINGRQLLQQSSHILSPEDLAALRADKDVQALLKAIK